MVNQKYGLQWLSDFANAHGKPMGFSEWGIQSDNAQRYVANVAKWFATHNVAYQSYWNSNSGGFSGDLSHDFHSRIWPTAARRERACRHSDDDENI